MRSLTCAVLITWIVGCSGASSEPVSLQPSLASLQRADCAPTRVENCESHRLAEGRRLFDEETFDGNGRRCVTCHSVETGTINPAQVAALAANDPLFRHDGLDATGGGTTRIRERATILVELQLPWFVTLADAPEQRTVVVERGVPSTINAPAFDKYLQWDLRIVGPTDQATAAIEGHAQAGRPPTPEELELIAEFESRDRRFFSSDELHAYANKRGLAPGLPEGVTEAEKRGRVFFEDAPFNPPDLKGMCALCHSGTLLNAPNAFFETAFPGESPLTNAHSIGVSRTNLFKLPERTYLVVDACGNERSVTTPDPGLLLTDPWTIPELLLPPWESCQVHPAAFANAFKTPGLRGIARTAPYFHDNSAATLEDSVRHYNVFLELIGSNDETRLSEQDIADIAVYMKLL